MRAGLTFSVVGSLFDPGAPRRSSLGLDGADETGLPQTESLSPVFARVRVGALDAARPDRRAVTVFVARKTGCGEETTIFPGSLAHEANGSTHNKRQYQPLIYSKLLILAVRQKDTKSYRPPLLNPNQIGRFLENWAV